MMISRLQVVGQLIVLWLQKREGNVKIGKLKVLILDQPIDMP